MMFTATPRRSAKVGDRVEEPFGLTRGWVYGLQGREALVSWDDPHPHDEELGNFDLDQLKVIPSIPISIEELLDPGAAPEIENVCSYGFPAGVRYVFVDGRVATSKQDALMMIIGGRVVESNELCPRCGTGHLAALLQGGAKCDAGCFG